MDAEGAAPGAKGTDWTAEQIAIVVANYFLMLDREPAGDKINKADLYRKLAPEVKRSEKSIEWKLRSVSAVLEEIGIAWIPGLLPAHNYEDSVEAVDRASAFRSPPTAMRISVARLRMMSRARGCQHNDANVLAMGGRMIGEAVAKECVEVFLNTKFDGGRHQKRVDKLGSC